jgi:hypothetical protein
VTIRRSPAFEGGNPDVKKVKPSLEMAEVFVFLGILKSAKIVEKMKHRIILILILLLLPSSVLAINLTKEETYPFLEGNKVNLSRLGIRDYVVRADLDADGKVEIIVCSQNFLGEERLDISAVDGEVSILRTDFEELGKFRVANRMAQLEFVHLYEDASTQLVVWSFGGAHYTNIYVYGFKNGELYKIFENGSACPVDADFESDKPWIKVGRANWEKEGWCYAGRDESLWQIYLWNGKEFVYDDKLSTTLEISEEEEVGRYTDRVMQFLEKNKNE